MLRDFTWSFFEKTGNIEAFLEYSKMCQQAKEEGPEHEEHAQGTCH